jgi:hypothetical protein
MGGFLRGTRWTSKIDEREGCINVSGLEVEHPAPGHMGIRAHPRLTSGKTSKGQIATQSRGCAGQTVRPSLHPSRRPWRGSCRYQTRATVARLPNKVRSPCLKPAPLPIADRRHHGSRDDRADAWRAYSPTCSDVFHALDEANITCTG